MNNRKICNHCGINDLDELKCPRCDVLVCITLRELEEARGINPRRKFATEQFALDYIGGDPCSEQAQQRLAGLGYRRKRSSLIHG